MFHPVPSEDNMERGGMDATPYPGPPMNPNVGFNQPVGPAVVMLQQPQQPLPTVLQGRMVCPHCQNSVVTDLEHKIGFNNWISCFVLGASVMCLPFCWIPFCVKSCKDVEHSCPRCHKVIHIHKMQTWQPQQYSW
ncbi:lipopolysaccharide-induced tumor necrosis factor-alpha factor homolog [Notolabrus celidotus]|uniref:lipopolysaccharide-induced tumor necrosis factor-alpha factor homolog n=1 Tax=Notolabrus celidotus TaxID=1203425 RepID=UPI00148F90E7|nr:lipopolysaccharide-induced tumor necrosis factor-alpha factor homolog [Notolabrus celidotus]